MSKLVNNLNEFASHQVSTIGNRLVEEVQSHFYPTLPTVNRAELEAMDIPTLYNLLDHLVADDLTLSESIRQSIHGQISFLYEISSAVINVRNKNLPHLEANAIIKRHETNFLARLQAAGLKLDFQSEVSPEEIAQRPALILATHQGGGWENYLCQAITNVQSGMVIKGELMQMPYISDAMKSKQAIPVQRKKLRDPQERHIEIKRIATELVNHLSSGENMLVFYEGTRSKNGEIASTPNRRQWAQDLLTAVDQAWSEREEAGEQKQTTFQKLLLVVHTKTSMPDTPEEEVFLNRFRLNTTLAARMVRADNLSLQESQDHYDPKTLFGKSRQILKDLLISLIEEHQQKPRK